MYGCAGVVAALVALGAQPDAADSTSLAHRPVACVPVDRYAKVTAEAPDATGAELQFRTDAAGGWYSAPMAREGGRWVGFLPRPARGTARVEYRVVVTGADARTAATEPAEVRVADAGAECDAESSASVDTPIVVTVPAGAPLVPPVPAGLSPAGVTGAAARPRSNKGLKIAGAAAAVAIGAATATGVSQSREPPPEPFRIPRLSFSSTGPAPGSTISFAVHQPNVVVVMDHVPAQPLTFVWQVEYIGAPGPCVRMTGVFNGAQRPVGLVLSAPLVPTGACGLAFEVSALRIAVDYQGAVIYDETLALPFRFVP